MVTKDVEKPDTLCVEALHNHYWPSLVKLNQKPMKNAFNLTFFCKL